MLSTVQVIAAGSEGTEQMQLVVDDVLVQEWNVDAGADEGILKTYSHTSGDNFSAGSIRIRMVNADWDPSNGIDENLRVDAIIVDGQRFETEAGNVFSTGTWRPEDGIVPGFRQSEYLHENGYFQFAAQSVDLKIRARGSQGGEQFQVIANGDPIATFSATTSFQVFNLTAPPTTLASDLRIEFFGDQYDPSSGVDTNLIVDYIEVDSVRYQTESSTTYSTGTWNQLDGIAPGIRLSEILHSDGYFQYDVDSKSVLIRASGAEGNERFRLLIDGNAVMEQTVGTTLDSYVYWTRDNITADQIRIEFTNDTFDSSLGIDANLIVDYIEIDGVRFETEAPGVLATGYWVPGQGPIPGYYQTETLHTNGYFQYADQTIENGSFALDAGYYIVNEATGFIDVKVIRIGGTDGEVTIDYETFGSTAIADVDFAYREGTLQFADGQSEQDVRIDILADDLTEEGEQFSLVIDNPGGGAGLLSPRTATIEITNQPGQNVGPGDPELQVTTEILGNIAGAVALEWLPNDTMLIVDFGGAILRYENGAANYADPVIDIRDQVNGPRGMTAVALHPDLANNPYLYIGFAYDPPEVYQNTGLAGPDGLGNRASRVNRYTLDANNDYKTIVPGSEVVLLGTNSTWDNFNAFVDSTDDLDEPQAGIDPSGNYVRDFVAADSQSHTIGDLAFGPDGMLYVSNGDGTSYNAVDPRTLRVQDVDSLSGKILRIDPLTGQGLSDNPFYDGDPSSNRSKVFQLGLRNPFRIEFGADGQLYIGDVGWYLREEVNVGGAGANFGWPFYEGTDPTPSYQGLPEAIAFYASNPNVESPLVELRHVEDEIDAVILGEFVDASVNIPSEYEGHLIFSHLASGYVRAIEFDPLGNVTEVKTLFQIEPFMTELTFGPDGNLYFTSIGTRNVGRI